MLRGRPTLLVNGEPEISFFYALTDVPGGRWSWEELPRHNIAAFHRAGFRLFQLDIFLEHLWFPSGRIDVSLLKRQIRGVLEVAPDAAVMVRFHMNPPTWWVDLHPEEMVSYNEAPCESERHYPGALHRYAICMSC